MISKTTAFWTHFVVNCIFSAPAVFLGLSGFLGLMTEGRMTSADDFWMGLLAVDFTKNLFIGAVAYVGASCKDEGIQTKLVYANLLLMGGCLCSVLMYPSPSPSAIAGIPPPVVFYLGVAGGGYLAAALGGSKSKSN